MSNTNQQVLQTQVMRENNPKAVFFGHNQNLIAPIAGYLAQRNVDLYSGKELSDSFFGNYFFYVGSYSPVESFLADKGKQLPLTLLILTEISDIDRLEKSIKIPPLDKLNIISYHISKNLC